jgi:hypothetical protein
MIWTDLAPTVLKQLLPTIMAGVGTLIWYGWCYGIATALSFVRECQ